MLSNIEVNPSRRPAPWQESAAAIVAVGSAFPDRSYSQEEIGALLGLENRVVKKLLRSAHIQKSHLYLPAKDARTGPLLPGSSPCFHAKLREAALSISYLPILTPLHPQSPSTPDS